MRKNGKADRKGEWENYLRSVFTTLASQTRFTYLGRTEHGEDAKFTPYSEIPGYPKGYVDPLTWDKGEWKGAGKWWIDRAKCNVCGTEVEGHPDSGRGATIGLPRFSKAKEEHVCRGCEKKDFVIVKHGEK